VHWSFRGIILVNARLRILFQPVEEVVVQLESPFTSSIKFTTGLRTNYTMIGRGIDGALAAFVPLDISREVRIDVVE
jgi:hypothetical protein